MTVTKELTREIAKNPYCWPGGYLRVALLSDFETLCPHCVRENYKLCAKAEPGDQWEIVSIGGEYNGDFDFGDESDPDAPRCAHCHKPLYSL